MKVYTNLKEALANMEDVKAFRFSRNPMVVLPSDITQFPNLETLIIQRCESLNLENSMEILKELPNLKHLDLSWNRITKLPNNIDELSQLETLNLKENRLLDLPKAFGKLDKLKSLNLRHNLYYNVESVFKIVSRLESLEELDISFSQLVELSDKIGDLSNLRVLNLEGNGILTLPASITKCQKLEVLILKENFNYGEIVDGRPELLRIDQATIYPLLARLPNLRKLDLSKCWLPAIDPAIAQLTQLKVLDLSRNRLDGLPNEIGSLAGLEELDISNPINANRTNQIRSLPASFTKLSNLKRLNCQANEFTNLKLSNPAGLASLEHLDFGWNRLTEFPEELRAMKSLRYLNLNVNLVTELPVWIGDLANLEEFHLDGDFFLHPNYKLKVLPTSIGDLGRLRHLSLADQVIEQLPSTIGNLSQLRHLDIRDNLLSALPPELGQLTHLEFMDLKANEIQTLPPELGNCKQLKELNLSFNLDLDATREVHVLEHCTGLEKLDISFTRPISLAQLKEIRKRLPGALVVYAEVGR